MKRSRIIWILVVGAIVYWGAAYPTLGNWIEALLVKLQPLGQIIDEKTNILIEKINSTDLGTSTIIINRILLGLSCLAFILAIIYRPALKKGAELRNATGELNGLFTSAAICVALSFFSHDSLHWWSIIIVPIYSFVILYPLLYIPWYRYFRFIHSLLFGLMVIPLGLILISGYMTQETLVWKIIESIAAIFALWYYIAHRKSNSCPKCKRYSNIEKHIISSTSHRMKYKVKVAVAWLRETTYYKNGDKSVRITPTEFVDGTQLATTTTSEYEYSCPCCGHKWSDDDCTVIETKEDDPVIG